ncbi:protein phosphatase 1 regulatory subunit 37 isoform X2 [Betta splendens]|nr:protein phosphatase 1 regulatory subunit 37 isoform X2 [Betta splendens]XP_040929309.1 protein phosphatase 1 regulatory subunit 37 isoform X2 [Betta splendens]
MPQLTDNLQAEEDNHPAKDTLEIDEVNGNGKSSEQDTNPTQHKDSNGVQIMKEAKGDDPAKIIVGEGNEGAEMDIGVDLSLDESGVLEADITTVISPTDNALDLDSMPQDILASSSAESPSDASQTSNTETTAPDQAGLYPLVEEEDSKHKPSGKRVTFPSDDDIVSGAVEPKDPWRHAQNATVDEILSCYRQACQKLNCKPIPKVLKQIQELKDLTQRNECFDLKGEKLDYKACESLEEILKRVQFKLIDLEQTNLDEDGASALFDMIEYYESATHLNISFNKHIGTRGWQAAAHMMRKTSSLLYLDARNTPLLDHSAPFVARALRISGSLAVLHLENAGLSGRPLMLLATALKMNMNLRELYLADNKLNGLQDSAQLGNLLKFNYNIQILDLRNNHILDSGLAYVCEGLKEQRKGLVTLVLWNNQLTHNGMGYLAAALPCTQSLETLNLGHNSIGNEGVHKLKDGLIANRSVLRLGLASTKLSCEGAVAVAEFIAESPRLLRLDLRENEIKTGGLMALSLALKVNTSLLRLDLDREPKKETVKSFIETQRALLAEIQNGCKRNFILAKEKEENEQKMRQSASMAEISTEDGAEEEEEEPASDNRSDGEEQQEKNAESTAQTSSQSEPSSDTSIPQMNIESDSDTEDEEEEEVVTKSSPTSDSSTHSNQTTTKIEALVTQPPSGASHPSSSPSASPTGGQNVVSSITVMESSAPPGTPPSPGRCISVSSPGRGHKIFMVTRVESPPEQQQQQQQQQLLQIALPASSSQTKEASKEPTDATPPQTQTTPASQTPTQTLLTLKENSPPPSKDCKLTEQSSVALFASTPDTTQMHTLEPISITQPTPSTLDPDVTHPSLHSPGLLSAVSPVQITVPQPCEEATEGTNNPLCEQRVEEETEKGSVADRQLMSSDSAEEELDKQSQGQQQPELQNELAYPSEQAQSPKQVEEEDKNEMLSEEKQEAPQAEEPSVTEGVSDLDQAGPEADEQGVDAVLSVQTNQQAPSVALHPASTEPVEASTDSLEEEESADENSDEGECFAEALDGEVVASALPNGLKPEFSLHLLEAESPKPGSCVMEHVSVSCGQDLEELLLEASLETGREAP